MSEDSDAEREHEPTAKRLEDARAKGDLLRSPDLNHAAAMAGLALAVAFAGVWSLDRIGLAGQSLIARAGELRPLSRPGGGALLAPALGAAFTGAMPLLLAPAACLLALLLAQRAFVLVPDNLAPKIARISPIANFAQRFGRSGLVAFGKSLAKLSVVSLVMVLFLSRQIETHLAAQLLPAPGPMLALLHASRAFLLLIAGLAVPFAVADVLWQWAERRRRLRMTRQEMLDEFRHSEGDPHMKGRRRQRGREIATSRMLRDVARADVVVVNPTHFAVALTWHRGRRAAPVCVAKGTDGLAARIREAAALAGVPIRSDPPTARALHATVQVGEEIRPEHYRAVAAAIRFAERMRRNRAGRV